MASSLDEITFDPLESEFHRLRLENMRLSTEHTEVTRICDELRKQLLRLHLDESTSVPSLPAPEAGFPGVCSDIEKGGMHSLDRVRGKTGAPGRFAHSVRFSHLGSSFSPQSDRIDGETLVP